MVQFATLESGQFALSMKNCSSLLPLKNISFV